MRVSIIVAMDQQGLIGRNNGLPWKLSADLKHFSSVTMGKSLIMGRKTYESIGRPLKDRKNIVVTSNTSLHIDSCTVALSLEQAILACHSSKEIMVIGGALLYKQFLPTVGRIYLTYIHDRFEGDTWFPKWELSQWRVSSSIDYPADEKNPYPYSFVVYDKV